MDTTWFAIDADGFVAAFDTGEPGAMPAGAPRSEDGIDLMAAGRAEEAPLWDLAGLRARAGGALHAAHEHGFTAAVVVPTAGATPSGGEELPATSGRAFLLRRDDAAVLARLHAEQGCAGCFPVWEESLPGARYSGGWLERGAYLYEQESGSYDAEPYARAAVPRRPLHVSELPREARELVERKRFATLRFAETPRIQPVDHFDCVAWGSAWGSLEGTGHELDGDSEEDDDGAAVEDPTSALAAAGVASEGLAGLDVPGAAFFLAAGDAPRVIVVGRPSELEALAARPSRGRECRLVARGVLDEGQAHLSFERPPGDSLRSVVEGLGWLDEEHARRVLLAVARAVAERHAVGEVHGELGRSLDLVWLDGAGATLLPPCLPPRALRRGAAVLVAPETLLQSATDPRTDVWGLGLLAFQVATGRRYFPDVRGPTAGHAAVLQGPLPRASERARALGAPEPTWLDGWLARCLERDRRERFADPMAAVEALGRA